MAWTEQQVRQLVHESSERIGGCPPAETLVRAMSGTLPRDEAEAVADHLSACTDCADDARAVRGLESWAGRAALEGATPGRRTREITTRRWTSHPLLAIAAVLFLATVALSIALLRARGQGGQPLPNVAVVSLLPASAGGSRDATAPLGAEWVVGVLTVPGGTERYGDYAIEVWRGDALAYRGQGFVRGREDTVTIALPAGLLAGGVNRIRLFGMGRGDPAPLAEYALRLSGS